MTNPANRAPRVTRAIMRRSLRLLHMEYKPSELAEVLRVSTATVYNTYLLAGCPHRREANGNIWIIGTEFREWADTALEHGKRYVRQRREAVGENQAYCLTCKSVRDFARITRRKAMSMNRVMVYGICATCGGKIATIKKGSSDDKSK